MSVSWSLTARMLFAQAVDRVAERRVRVGRVMVGEVVMVDGEEDVAEDRGRGMECGCFELSRPGVSSWNTTSLEKWYLPFKSLTPQPFLPSSYLTNIPSNRLPSPLTLFSFGSSGKHLHPQTRSSDRSGFLPNRISKGVTPFGRVEDGRRSVRYCAV
jgi:hypothetical protein